ncbi:hypothetical protein [Mucilaginibacter phenanthrenivorans]|nr:hypothetical protein [Mucilaginibacter phenanthrenivorans]
MEDEETKTCIAFCDLQLPFKLTMHQENPVAGDATKPDTLDVSEL